MDRFADVAFKGAYASPVLYFLIGLFVVVSCIVKYDAIRARQSEEGRVEDNNANTLMLVAGVLLLLKSVNSAYNMKPLVGK